MRQGVTGTRTDNIPVAVVGLGMALISTLVALSGLDFRCPRSSTGSQLSSARSSTRPTRSTTAPTYARPRSPRCRLDARRAGSPACRPATGCGPRTRPAGVTPTRGPARHDPKKVPAHRQSLHAPRLVRTSLGASTPPRQPSGQAPARAFVHPMRTPQRRSPRPAARRSTRPAARRSTAAGGATKHAAGGATKRATNFATAKSKSDARSEG